MHYTKWSRVMLSVVLNFEEFELPCNFLLYFCFLVSFSIGKNSTLEKIWGEAAVLQLPLVSTCRPDFKGLFFNNMLT